jgi:hypothetical protein
MSRLEYLGYRVVKDDPKKRKWVANGAREDGTYIMGDLILMEIEADLHDALLRNNEDRARAQVGEAQEGILANADEAGVPTFSVKR